MGRGLEAAGLEPADLCPIADGGDGTAEILLLALGGETGAARVTGPLGEPVTAGIALLEGGALAVVEVAAASGLALVPDPSPTTAVAATSHGTGELVLAAVDAGAEVVAVAAGGSACTDGGAGAIDAIEAGGGLRGATLLVLCDVRTPFEQAAEVFAPQKGADGAAVRELRARLDALARSWPRDPRGIAGAGAAGGLAGGLHACLGARLVRGADFVLDAVGFDARMRAARAVVVGEGRLDRTTLHGKGTGEAATRARQAGVPCHAIVGADALEPFGKRILDLQVVLEASSPAELEQAGEQLGRMLRDGRA